MNGVRNMKIVIERPLTRIERVTQILSLLQEAEEYGYARISIDINDHQIVNSKIEKNVRYGNCPENIYEPLTLL